MKPLIWTWSDVEGQRPALLICTAAAGPTQGVKAYPDATMHRQLLAPVEGRMAETLNQKLHVANVLEDDPGYLPHVYSEEGECGGAPSLSSLASLEQELQPDLLDSLGSKATPFEEIYSESGVPS
ncbi:cadherin 26 [Homo sapiens]|uniref:Isoform 4 of Cadherin-like protein 26 n=1 Tax=Homo sapiens TaxID=9606 RepID=Q8IXH8-5|eukprot:NP_001335133.1 cadherin-like protein 26 isoform c [Homo sapiens]